MGESLRKGFPLATLDNQLIEAARPNSKDMLPNCYPETKNG